VRAQISPEEIISYLRERGMTLSWDQAAGVLSTGTEAVKIFIAKAS
jgi:hypothetical protein